MSLHRLPRPYELCRMLALVARDCAALAGPGRERSEYRERENPLHLVDDTAYALNWTASSPPPKLVPKRPEAAPPVWFASPSSARSRTGPPRSAWIRCPC